MLYLMSSPIFYLKLRNEIDAAIGDGKMSSPITDAEAKELPYLQGIIKEGLRRFPPAAGMTPRKVPPGGDTFNGVFIPEGTDVGYPLSWYTARRASIAKMQRCSDLRGG
jgi:cytochrome P450